MKKTLMMLLIISAFGCAEAPKPIHSSDIYWQFIDIVPMAPPFACINEETFIRLKEKISKCESSQKEIPQ